MQHLLYGLVVCNGVPKSEGERTLPPLIIPNGGGHVQFGFVYMPKEEAVYLPAILDVPD